MLLVPAAAMLAPAGSAGAAAPTEESYVRIAEIDVDPARVEAYTIALKEHIETALRVEPGILALYSVADKDNTAHVIVFEIYRDRQAYDAHLATAHFSKYKLITNEMVQSLKLREATPILLGAKPK
jgi:quinol monooxygenase YgiN